MLAWQRHGPVVYRLRELFAMVMTLLATCVLALVSLSVLSLYPGAGAIRPGASEQPVRATVKECHRVGPLSGYGMGYWWICQAVVRHDEGPERQVELGRSIVGPDDVGQVVELRAVCRGRERPTATTEGRWPSSWCWAMRSSKWPSRCW